MGQTELFMPLKAIFEIPIDPDFRRQLFLLTDGAVINADAVIDLAKKSGLET